MFSGEHKSVIGPGKKWIIHAAGQVTRRISRQMRQEYISAAEKAGRC
jgi:hypothetical protein